MVDKTFVKITNKDIYEEIKNMRKDMKTMQGNININKWVASTSLFIVLSMIFGSLVPFVSGRTILKGLSDLWIVIF